MNPALDATASDAKKETPKPTDPGPADAELVFSVPSPVMKGTETTVMLTATSATSGEIRIERAMDDDGNYTTHEKATKWEIVAQQDVSVSNTTSYKFTPGEAGSFGFKGKYIPKGGSGFLAKEKPVNMEVIEECASTTLTGRVERDINVTNLNDGEYQFKATFTIKACEKISGAKLQGGLTAEGDFIGEISVQPSPYNINPNKQNYVVSWSNIEIDEKDTKTFTITFKKKMSGIGTHKMTGDWTLKASDGTELATPVEPIYYTFQ